MSTATSNPLFFRNGLPRFTEIQTEHVVPGVNHILEENRTRLERLEAELERIHAEGRVPAWEELFAPLEAMQYDLQMTWGPVSHLMGVLNSQELRDAYESVLPKVVNFSLRSSQSEPLFRAFESLRNSTDYENLSEERKRILNTRLQDARHSGIGLEGAKKERFNEIVNRLSKLSTQFSNNVLDSTKAFSLDLTRAQDVEGLPSSLLALASQNYNSARSDGTAPSTAESGPWRITLDYPVFVPFMQHCRHRDLRQQVYMAFIQRASTDKFDNTPLIQEILTLRKEKAELLGYASHAELSLSEKMAGQVAEVDGLLEELRVASLNAGKRDLEEVRQVAAEHGQSEPINNGTFRSGPNACGKRASILPTNNSVPTFPCRACWTGCSNWSNESSAFACAPPTGKHRSGRKTFATS